jgi:hypothetical protein
MIRLANEVRIKAPVPGHWIAFGWVVDTDVVVRLRRTDGRFVYRTFDVPGDHADLVNAVVAWVADATR